MISEPKPKRRLYNPTMEDVAVSLDLLGENPQHYILKKHDFGIFQDHVATMIEEKLVDRMYWRNPPKRGKDKYRAKLLGIIRA